MKFCGRRSERSMRARIALDRDNVRYVVLLLRSPHNMIPVRACVNIEYSGKQVASR